MPRTARAVFPGLPHHIVQRGNRREDVFFGNGDRITYLDWLTEYCGRHDVTILAYCLMTNHVHVVAVPGDSRSFERAFRPLHTRYAMRVNRKRSSTGHVWQGRFFSAALDEAYLWAAVRYVERNPVRAGMVSSAEEYRWSSASAHCGLGHDRLLVGEDAWLADMKGSLDWARWLKYEDEPGQLAVLRENARTGEPCGTEAFIQELERRAGRPLRPRSGQRRRRTIELSPRGGSGVRPQAAVLGAEMGS